MGILTAAGRPRRIAASASLGAATAVLAVLAVRDAEWALVALSALTAASAIGLLRRSVLSQVLSRGAAWLILVPSVAWIFGGVLEAVRMPGPGVALVAAASASALLFARGALLSDEAKAEFSPVAYRPWFLAGSVAAVVEFLVVGALSFVEVLWAGTHATTPRLGLMVLAVALLASAVGVVRMRAWGVLLGVATSALMLVANVTMPHDPATGILLALGALPGLLLVVPLVAARIRPPVTRPSPAVGARFAAEDLSRTIDEAPAVYTRVESPGDIEEEDEPVREGRAPPRNVPREAPAVDAGAVRNPDAAGRSSR